ncbi:glycosyltransferase [Thermasporomyces composti]|jgi:glycosyltransferase involved in cell wall biosynthesis|uniref:Glycosyltransferase involved in cell wall biosynthesis n=1 Tax=Thermasporomyces composti TaxID=696763 RepID=A0A3D9VC83_THECX|nr:glycosyltransferase [Thermasporomyces composti]REF36675.1 glycosyltransferase involved in cell wall biosynthesis [Thermasporomyces composti]
MPPLRVLVCTVVHHPQDARILHRQIKAMVEAGYSVTYAAPFSAYDAEVWPEIEAIDLPRASGRSRVAALRAARRVLRERGRDADIVLLHDPELLLVLPGLTFAGAVVWDVHEDTGAALVAKSWIPGALRPLARAGIRLMEGRAERTVRLILAEEGYRARFRGIHPVIPNTTYVPDAVVPPGERRVVYVGHLARARGVDVMVEAARLLRGHGVTFDVIGHADNHARRLLLAAQEAGDVHWHGFVANDKAMALVRGALCGLSLLRDLPNYRHSMPTKVLEYMAQGVPVVTTPLPAAVSLIQIHGCGLVVPFDDPEATARAVLRLRDDAELRVQMGQRGHQAARVGYHWPDTARDFLGRMEAWAKAARPNPCLTLGTS